MAMHIRSVFVTVQGRLDAHPFLLYFYFFSLPLFSLSLPPCLSFAMPFHHRNKSTLNPVINHSGPYI
jgi:hypothetical protein